MSKTAAFVQSIMIADATQGGISYEQALRMTAMERKAAISVINKIRVQQKKDIEKNSPKK